MIEAKIYENIMESIVATEVEQQKAKLAPQIARSVNSTDVITYALNRLPSLYASSEEGRKRQIQKAKKRFGQDISIAVRRGFAAVQRNRRSPELFPIGAAELESELKWHGHLPQPQIIDLFKNKGNQQLKLMKL